MQDNTDLVRCAECPHTVQLVGSKGPVDSPFVIVGESPGRNEVREKQPFVGPSGAILNGGLAQHPDIIPYITNAMACFPGITRTKSLDKIVKATECCRPRLHQEIGAYPRKVILALGNAALWGVTGDFSTKITQVRGKVFKTPLAEHGVVASVHPSYLMRGGGSLRQFLADVDYACSLLKGNDFRKYVIPKFHVLNSVDEILQIRQKMMELPEGTPVAADTETGGYDGFDYLRDHILCSGFCWDSRDVFVVPEHLTQASHHLFLDHLRYIWHNGKFDAKFELTAGVHNVRIDEDTMLLSYALDETKGIHDLESVGSDLIGVPDWKFMIKPYLEAAKANKEFSPKLTLDKKGNLVRCTVTYDCIPRPVLYDYMSRDISTTLQVFPILRRNVAIDAKLELLYTQTLMPASDYFRKVEMNGMKLDLGRVEQNHGRLNADIETHKAEINRLSQAAGYVDVNPNSPKQLGTLLFDVVKLPTKTRSTDKKELEHLDHPVVFALKKYRKVKKADSTYVVPAPSWVNKDGRVHTTYKIIGTVTGRPASEDPNLLNIPRDPLLRGQFEADEGNIFLEVDANQAELRVLADLSNDEELTRIYTTEGMSLHDVVTKDVILKGDLKTLPEEEVQRLIVKFNCQHFPEKLYDEAKMRAKNVNFGIVYGITPFGLAEQIDDSPQEAKKFLDAWMEKFKGAARFIRLCREAPVKNKTFVTPFGRKRRFGVVSPERLADIQNQAANFPEQSIASDYVLHTGLRMAPIIEKLKTVRIVNTVYDSILYELPNDKSLVEDLAAQTIDTLAQVGKDWGAKRIPILGEAKAGHRWGQLKDLKKFYESDDDRKAA